MTTSTYQAPVKTVRLPEVEHVHKASLTIADTLQNQIDYLHKKVGNDEWSGVLVYEVVEGTITNPATLKIVCHAVFPLDIGTSAYTEYSIGTKIMDIMEEFPQLMEEQEKWKMGHIHSHHSMSTFFSGVDTDELHENAINYVYYLSLIVNFAGTYCAKIAIRSKEEDRRLIHKTENGERAVTKIAGVDRLILVDCEIEKRELPKVEDWFYTQFAAVEEEVKQKKEAAKAKPVVYYNQKKDYYKHDNKQVQLFNTEESKDSLPFTHVEVLSILSKWIALDATSDSALAINMKAMDKKLKDDKSFGDFYTTSLVSTLDIILESVLGEALPEGIAVFLTDKLLTRFDAILNTNGYFDTYDCLPYIIDAMDKITMAGIEDELVN